TGQRHIREAAMANLRLQDSLKEAQLNSLSGQLNPHFLFNSLNNLRFMIHEDAQRADAMVLALSDILRYSLESGRQAKVQLAREMEIIHRYIDVVRAQLEDRLRFTFHVPNELQACMVPPMLLQLLVENAIKHGIGNLRGGGSLQLQVGHQERQLVLQVRNDMPPAHLSANAGTGLGLANIERRLQLLYGGRATMQAGPAGGQFEVQVRLPKEY
ncbi:MAG TPA: histidine kinase, partial [Pseudoduganella sp.]